MVSTCTTQVPSVVELPLMGAKPDRTDGRASRSVKRRLQAEATRTTSQRRPDLLRRRRGILAPEPVLRTGPRRMVSEGAAAGTRRPLFKPPLSLNQSQSRDRTGDKVDNNPPKPRRSRLRLSLRRLSSASRHRARILGENGRGSRNRLFIPASIFSQHSQCLRVVAIPSLPPPKLSSR